MNSSYNNNFIYNTKTSNLSFIQLSVDLHKLGIKNNKFFLKLYDVSLVNVDPFDDNLSQETIARIFRECYINPWYFFREISRIPDQGGTSIPFQINRASLASIWCFINSLNHYLVIPRQIGKTTVACAELLYAYIFGTSNSEFMLVNIKEENSKKNLQQIKDQKDLLPLYMQFKEFYDDVDEGVKKETNNVKSLISVLNNNKIVAKSSATNYDSAMIMGRGASQPIQYFDEVEFTKFIDTIIEASGPAFQTASTNAKRNNALTCRILTTTPGDLDSAATQSALKILNETAKFNEKFYDWTLDEVHEFINMNSGNDILYIEFHYKQLGRDDEWFRTMCKTVGGNPVAIKREILLQRMRGNSNSPYEQMDLDQINSLMKEPIEQVFFNKNYVIDIYEKLNPNQVYFIGIDPAGGYGSDNSAITIYNPYTMKPDAEFASSYISVTLFTELIIFIVKKLVPKSIVIVERNSLGEAILDSLRRSPIVFNLYWDDTLDDINETDHLDDKGFLRSEAAKRKLYGLYTSPKLREIYFEILERWVNEYKSNFVTQNIINDLMHLIRKSNGRIEADAGTHDDSIMSFLLILYIFYHGRNLSRYGYNGRNIQHVEKTPVETFQDVYQELSTEEQEYFKDFAIKEESDRQKEIYAELYKREYEANQIRKQNGVEESGVNYYNEITDSSYLSLFDELNDL